MKEKISVIITEPPYSLERTFPFDYKSIRDEVIFFEEKYKTKASDKVSAHPEIYHRIKKNFEKYKSQTGLRSIVSYDLDDDKQIQNIKFSLIKDLTLDNGQIKITQA